MKNLAESFHMICIAWGLRFTGGTRERFALICSGLMACQKYVFRRYLSVQNECAAVRSSDSCIRREMPRAFIWYVYCKGLLHLTGQERTLGDSAPSRASPPNCPNDHSSTTNWCSIVIQVSIDGHTDGVAKIGLPKSRPAAIGGFSLAFLILLESGIKLPRT